LIVFAVVFLVLLYRLGVAGLIYRLVSNIPGGPSVGDIVVSISGACIQLLAILILNRLYEYFAYKLTSWGEGLIKNWLVGVKGWLNDQFGVCTITEVDRFPRREGIPLFPGLGSFEVAVLARLLLITVMN